MIEIQMPPYEANSRSGHHRQNPRSRFQNLRLQYKGLATRNMHMKYKSPVMIWPKLKLLKSGSNFKVKVKKYGLVPLECSCHKEHTYEIPITCHSSLCKRHRTAGPDRCTVPLVRWVSFYIGPECPMSQSSI
jgi:hypothetical protein